MASKKTPAAPAASKAPAKTPTIAVTGAIPKLTLDMPLDARKIKAIQSCLAKGKLTITVSKVDLGAGSMGGPWLYD